LKISKLLVDSVVSFTKMLSTLSCFQSNGCVWPDDLHPPKWRVVSCHIVRFVLELVVNKNRWENRLTCHIYCD